MSEETVATAPTESLPEGVVRIGKTAKAGIPPAFSERCVVRIRTHKFGPNSNQKPMITVEPELIGYFPQADGKSGELTNTLEKGGDKYIIGGLDIRSAYFTLDGGGLEMYADFWNKAHPGEELTQVSVVNPEREYLSGLMMQCVVSGRMEVYRRRLTEEEQAEKKARGERPLGEPILDEDGKPIEIPVLQISKWLRKYVGTVPEGTPPY